MINISEHDKELWRSGNVKKHLIINFPELNITLTNSDIVIESMELVESIESDSNLSFMGCIASKFKITFINLVQDVRNRYMEVGISCGTISDMSDVVPLFKGYVYDQTNATQEDFETTITAYDPLKKMLDADVTNWYNGLTFPITIRNFRDLFFAHFNILQDSGNLVNDTLTINKTIDDAYISGSDIIRWLCQLNGSFGQFGRDGKFHYRRLMPSVEALYPAEDLYPADDLYPSEANAQERVYKATYNKINYQPYHTKVISKVIIVNQNGAQGGAYGDNTSDTLYIADNKLAWGVTGNIACRNILDVVKNLSFTPATIVAKGLPYLECGDIIVSNTRINVVQSYITTRTLDGIQGLSDTFDSESKQQRKAYKLSQATEISANDSKANTAQSTASTAQSTANTARSEASTAQGTANTARGEAQNAQGTANNAIQRVGAIEADYVKTASITAVNGRIDNLSATVATINRLYVTSAQANTIASNAITAKLGTLQALAVSGRVTASSFGIGGTTFTTKQWNVRLANGGTQIITYLGAT